MNHKNFDYRIYKNRKKKFRSPGIDISRIEHIGSTAINGIKAKPMIDITVGVQDMNNVASNNFKSLQEISFYRLRVVLDSEIVLARFDNDKTFDVKTHIIHLIDFSRRKME